MSNVLKVGKKVLTVGTVMSTMVWSVGVSALLPMAASAANCQAFQSGDLLKVSGKPAIYAVDSNGKVLYFPSGDEFKSWNVDEKYSGYTTVSQECYDAMPVPTMSPFGVNFRPGSYIVKRASSDQLYVVEPNNTLAKITVDAAKALYGTSYKVMTVADVFWTNYANRGADITEAKAHPGMLVSTGGKTYYVDADSKLWEVTAAGMTANRFKAAFVRPVAASAIAGLATGGTLDASNAKLADRSQTGGGSATTPGTVVTGGALNVSLAASNPAGTVLGSGSAFNSVLKLNLAAGSQDVSVTGLTLRKSGFAANASVNGIELIDSAGVRHGNVASSVNPDNDVTLLFASSPITVKAGSTETVTVRINISSATAGQSGTLAFSVLNANSIVSNGTVGGSFPVTGNTFTLQNAGNTLGSATVTASSLSVTSATLDSTNQQELVKFNVQAGSAEAVKLSKMTVYNNGTAADSDVQDVQLVAQDGTVLATAQQINKNVTFDLSAAPYLIDKGVTKSFTVRAKVVGGAGRTIQYVVYNDYDVTLTGVTTATNVLASASTPVGSNITAVSINAGTLSFNKDVTSPSAAVAPGTNGVVLAKFYAKPTGENVELRKIGLGFQSASLATMYSGSFTVKVNGSSVYSGTPSDLSTSTTNLTAITLQSPVMLTAGQNNYITVEANISSQAATGATTTVRMSLTEYKLLVTNRIETTATSIVAGNQIAVKGGALKVTTLATPVAQSVVVGTSNVVLAQVELNASTVSSGENVRVSRVVFTNTLGTGTDYSAISNLAVYDQTGAPVASTVANPTNANKITFSFISPIEISKTGSVVLTLKGNVDKSVGTSHTYKVLAADVSASGKETGTNLQDVNAVTAGVGNGQAITFAESGTLTVSLVSGTNASPSVDQVVTVGQTNVPVLGFKLSAQKEPMKVTSLTLMASGTLRAVTDLKNVKLYRNNETAPFAIAEQMNVSAEGSTTSTVFTWTATDNLLAEAIQPGSPVTIYVKTDIGAAGNVYLGDKFRFVVNGITAKGASSNVESNPGVSGAAATGVSHINPFLVTVSGDFPAANSTLIQGINSNDQIARFKITNNGSEKVTIDGLKFTNSGSATTATYKLLWSDADTLNFVNAGTDTSGDLDFDETFEIAGGSSRYVTVAIDDIGNAAAGAKWQLSVASLGDINFLVSENDLGYDGNGDGEANANLTQQLTVSGKPVLGTLVKQAE